MKRENEEKLVREPVFSANVSVNRNVVHCQESGTRKMFGKSPPMAPISTICNDSYTVNPLKSPIKLLYSAPSLPQTPFNGYC